MMDRITARAWGRLQAELRPEGVPPRAKQADMFYPAHPHDAKALACAAFRQDETWAPPRGLGAAAKRLAKNGLLAKMDGGYRVTADGVEASRGGAVE